MIDQNHTADTPTQITRYDSKVEQLGVGKSGKVGILDVELESDKDGKTIIAKQFCQVPLQIQRALYPESFLPNMAYIYIASPSGGILQGDRYKTDILLKKNATSHITTQGATRIYSMNSNSASQVFNITLEENSYLEYIPDQIIPYQDSRYYQKVELSVHDTATIFYSEVLSPGRVAMGESFQYDICYFRMHGTNQEKKLRLFENSKITPKTQSLKDFGLLEKYQTVGTVYILAPKKITKILEEKLSQSVNGPMSFGTSTLADDSGIIIRILGDNTREVFDGIFQAARITRNTVLGAGFSSIRKS